MMFKGFFKDFLVVVTVFVCSLLLLFQVFL